MHPEQILAFRLARSGLASRAAATLAEGLSCPASDFSPDAALLALAARHGTVTRTAYEAAADRGEVIVAHVVRGAIHALAPRDFALYGRALIATDEEELAAQLGRQVQRLAAKKGFGPTDAVDEVAEATRDALGRGRALGKNDLHGELRERVSPDLMPWCEGCKSHHVAPMLWRYGGIKAGARLDSKRRYVLGEPGRTPAATGAVNRFLQFYGPATVGDFADWTGVARPHAERLWKQVEGDLSEVSVGRRRAWFLAADRDALSSPPDAEGVRFIPAGDPYLQRPNRPLLAPQADLRKRLFRPVASPGVVLADGRLAGLWRTKSKGTKAEITVETLGRGTRKHLVEEANRVAELRGASGALLRFASEG